MDTNIFNQPRVMRPDAPATPRTLSERLNMPEKLVVWSLLDKMRKSSYRIHYKTASREAHLCFHHEADAAYVYELVKLHRQVVDFLEGNSRNKHFSLAEIDHFHRRHNRMSKHTPLSNVKLTDGQLVDAKDEWYCKADDENFLRHILVLEKQLEVLQEMAEL